jgi:hypothetical protein
VKVPNIDAPLGNRLEAGHGLEGLRLVAHNEAMRLGTTNEGRRTSIIIIIIIIIKPSGSSHYNVR